MGDLWQTSELSEWAAHLAAYSDRRSALNNEKLTELDIWYQQELPQALQSRSPPYATSEEVVKVVTWKLTRGKWRPRLLDYAKTHTGATIKQATAAAFEALSSGGSDALKSAVSALAELKGIGPATASAVLAAYDASAPFMSDEALLSVLPGKKEYTLKAYLEFAAALQDKAGELSSEDDRWTASSVERALWSAAAVNMKPKAKAKAKQSESATQAGNKKRKR